MMDTIGGIEFVDPAKFSKLFKDGRSNMLNISEMLAERASLETKYSNSLVEWEHTYRKKLEQNKLATHQDMFYALKYVMDEGNQVAKAHKAQRDRLLHPEGALSLLKRWAIHGYGFSDKLDAATSTLGTLDQEQDEYKKCVMNFLDTVKQCRKSKQEHENLSQEMIIVRNKYDDKLFRLKSHPNYKEKLAKKEAAMMSLQCRLDTASSKYESWTNKLKGTQGDFVKESKRRAKCLIKQEEKRLAFLTDRLIQHLDDISLKNRSVPDGSDLQGIRKHLVGLQHDRQTRTWAHGSMNFIKCSDLQIVKSHEGHVGSTLLLSPEHPAPVASLSADDNPTTPLVAKQCPSARPHGLHQAMQEAMQEVNETPEKRDEGKFKSSESEWDSESVSDDIPMEPIDMNELASTYAKKKQAHETPASLYPNISPPQAKNSVSQESGLSGGLLMRMVGDGDDGVFTWTQRDDGVCRNSADGKGSDDDDLSVIELEQMPSTPSRDSLAKGGARYKDPSHNGTNGRYEQSSPEPDASRQGTDRKNQLPAPTVDRKHQLPAPTVDRKWGKERWRGEDEGKPSGTRLLQRRSNPRRQSSSEDEETHMAEQKTKTKKRMLRPLKSVKKVFTRKKREDVEYTDIASQCSKEPETGYRPPASNCIVTNTGIQFGEIEVLDPLQLQALSD